jgi:hypothetical protein
VEKVYNALIAKGRPARGQAAVWRATRQHPL